jgi:hypothetical protein
MKPIAPTHRGYMLIDALAGLVLLVALATVFARAHALQAGTNVRVHDQRRALQDAQTVLMKLQSSPGADAPKIDGAKISVTHLGKRSGSGEWIEVTVVREGRSASLVGLVSRGGRS